MKASYGDGSGSELLSLVMLICQKISLVIDHGSVHGYVQLSTVIRQDDALLSAYPRDISVQTDLICAAQQIIAEVSSPAHIDASLCQGVRGISRAVGPGSSCPGRGWRS
jgi:hypothetical protein